MSATRLAIIPQYSTGFNFIGNTFFLKICGIFIQPDGKHITLKVGTWITAFAKDCKGYLQYDKIQGCDEHCNVCNMTVAPFNLTVLTPPPSVEQELKHTAQHTLCYTLILTNIYTQSVSDSIIHINTNTQRQRQEQKHTYTDNDTEKDTNWLSHKLNCLQFVQPAQLTYFAFHKFGLCYSQAEFVLLTSWVCVTHKLSLCYSQAYLVPQEA